MANLEVLDSLTVLPSAVSEEKDSDKRITEFKEYVKSKLILQGKNPSNPKVKATINNIQDPLKANAGQQCSVAVAKSEGIFSSDGSSVFNSTISNTKGLSNDFLTNSKRYSVCNYDKKNNKASSNCGLNSPFLSKTGDNKCAVVSCPPGFNKINGECVLSSEYIKPYSMNKKNVCDEKIYDWFTIPNYHLGNRYKTFNKDHEDSRKTHPKNLIKCYEPCELGKIPYITDPTDISSDTNQVCINKEIADYGIYGEKSLDYCPLALIHLLGYNKELFRTDYESRLSTNLSANIKNRQANIEQLIENAEQDIKKSANTYIEFVSKQPEEYISKNAKQNTKEKVACMASASSKDIIMAHTIASRIKANPKYIDTDILPFYNYNNEKLKKVHKETLLWASTHSFSKNTELGSQLLDIGNRGLMNTYSSEDVKLLEDINTIEETEEPPKSKQEIISDRRRDNISKMKTTCNRDTTVGYSLFNACPGTMGVGYDNIFESAYSLIVGSSDFNNDSFQTNKYLKNIPKLVIIFLYFIILLVLLIVFVKLSRFIYNISKCLVPYSMVSTLRSVNIISNFVTTLLLSRRSYIFYEGDLKSLEIMILELCKTKSI